MVEPDLHVVSACRANGRDIRTAAAHSPVDLVLFDTALLALCGVACLADFRAVACDAKFVLLWDEAHPLAVEEIERQGEPVAASRCWRLLVTTCAPSAR